MLQTAIRCLRCGAPAGSCTCGSELPAAAGVRLATPLWRGLIQAWEGGMSHTPSKGPEAHNREVLRKAYAPAAALGEEPGPLELAVWQLTCSWDPALLLPYLHRDWAVPDALSDAASPIEAQLDAAGASRTRLVVLGCGGAGLCARLADGFEEAWGVDLALPGLLLAGRVLDGEAVTLAFRDPASGAPIESVLLPPDPRPKVSLLAGDVHDLPFADGNVSVLVTQYLVDVVRSLPCLADEIHRVLAPSGVWVDMGFPHALEGLDGFTCAATEDHALAAPRMGRTTTLEMPVRQARVTRLHPRGEPSATRAARLASLEAFARGDETALGLRPRLASGVEVTTARGTVRRADGLREVSLFRLSTDVAGSEPALEMPDTVSKSLAALLTWMDGQLTVRDFASLTNETPERLLDVLRLLERSGVVTWDAA